RGLGAGAAGGGLRPGAGLPRWRGDRRPGRGPGVGAGARFPAALRGPEAWRPAGRNGRTLMAGDDRRDPAIRPAAATGSARPEGTPVASEFDRQGYVAQLPHRPGVYQMLDADGTLLYVGKARDLRQPVSAYL